MTILDVPTDPNAQAYTQAGVWGRVTFDALLRRNLAKTPDRLALADAADRARWTDGSPRRLTYRQLDRAVSSLAARFQELGLKQGSVVGVQLPNLVEAPITILAAHRAGLVPALLPFLWRRAEIAACLEPLTPKALIGVAKAGGEDAADHLRYAAADLFSVRHVLAFGQRPPDGVVSLDDALDPVTAREPRGVTPAEDPGATVALVTFRTTPSGHAPIARTHNQCVAAGLSAVLEARQEPADVLLGTLMPSSFGAVATTLMPWLLTGGSLVLHQAFDADVFAATVEAEAVTRVVVPGALLDALGPVIAPLAGKRIKGVVAVHADARTQARAGKTDIGCDVVDIGVLDEWAILPRKRKGGEPRGVPAGPVRFPTDASSGPQLLTLSTSASGRLAVGGPMVPYDPDAEGGARATGLVVGEGAGWLIVKGRADAVAHVGGLGVGIEEIERHLLQCDEVDAVRVRIAADPLFGERLEAHVAPRVSAPTGEHVIIERLQDRLSEAGLAPHKVPSRIVVDHMVRADPGARQRGSMRAGAMG